MIQKRKTIWVASFFAVLIVVALITPSVIERMEIWKIAHDVRNASSADDEHDAFRRANLTVGKTYAVHFFDDTGAPLTLNNIQAWTDVETITIVWDYGITVSRYRIIDHSNIPLLLGE